MLHTSNFLKICVFIASFSLLNIAVFGEVQNGLQIILGQKVEEFTAPFVVGLWIGDKLSCTGSILKGSKRTIITAAHCVHEFTVAQLTIGVGSVAVQNLTKYKAESVLVHPYYEFFSFHDIALVYLAQDLEISDKVHGIELEKEIIPAQENATLYGWGWTVYPYRQTSTILSKIDVTTVSVNYCKLYWDMSTGDHICTTVRSGGACRGDSGGPLVRNNKLIGILSWGSSYCGIGYPDVHTRISTHVEWILANLI